jgi:hypothetical protein
MAFSSIAAGATLALPYIGIVLALANWHARPGAAWPFVWALAIVNFVLMAIARHRSPGNAPAVPIPILDLFDRGFTVNALLWVVPLAVTLAHAYGVVDDPESGRRAFMISFGWWLAAAGNAMPRMLPLMMSVQGDGARVQAFQRLAGWTWALCGVGWATAWLALPIDGAAATSSTLFSTAMLVTSVQVLRLRKREQHAPGLH